MIRGNRMYCGVLGRRHRHHRLHRPRQHGAGRPHQWSPPFPGSTHTCWPIGDKPYLIVTDEARAKQKYWDAQFMWVVDIREETNPIPVSTFFPDREKYFNRGGRFGAHNILENIRARARGRTSSSSPTSMPACAPSTSATRCARKRSAATCRSLPEGQQAIQSNDIGSDEHGRLYLIDRWGAGMHILEYTG